MGRSPRGYPARMGPPVMTRDQRHRMRHMSVGASAPEGDFTVSWVALGMLGREAEGGCARRVPQSPHVPSAEQFREPPRVPNYARMSL